MIEELYWYDNLIEAANKCKMTGDSHTFTADEVLAILECIETWNLRHDDWEKNNARLTAELAELRTVLKSKEIIIDNQEKRINELAERLLKK